MSFENITIRKPRIEFENSSDQSFVSTLSEQRTMSTPDLTNNYYYNSELEDLREELKHCKNQLESADEQIQELLLENVSLKKLSKEQERLLNTIKSIQVGSPILKNKSAQPSPATVGKKKKDLSKVRRNVIDIGNSNTIESELQSNLQHGAILDSTITPNQDSSDPGRNVIQVEVSSKNQNQSQAGTSTSYDIVSQQNASEQAAADTNDFICDRRKLCIVSSNNQNNVSLIIRNNDLLPDCDYCHYITPGAGIRQLLHDINNKTKTLTMKDFCLVMIGPKDFHSSNDYVGLVHHIREIIQRITNTNIIIALPTYITGTILYNSRVETFGTLLCNDIKTHKYANILDSNLNLTYDMFSDRTGKLNNRGMKNILENLRQLTKMIQNRYNITEEPQNNSTSVERNPNDKTENNPSMFFLL